MPRFAAGAVVAAMLLSACGGSDSEGGAERTDDAATDATTAENGGDAKSDGKTAGEVVVTGSSTVEPISSAVAEKFAAKNPNVAISVDGPGTGDGFEIFCAGQADITDASRPIKPEEAEKCESNGIEFIELKVAIDGLSVITSTENDAIECLSFLDLYALLGPESTGFEKWSDANGLAEELAKELGDEFGKSHAPYPDAPLSVTAPGEESGTFDSFVELVLEDIAEKRGQEAAPRPDYQASPNDNVIVEGVQGSPTSLGWVGYAFVVENPDAVKALPVDGGDGCMEPSDSTIADGSYPIARPLFIYVNKARAEENQSVVDYVDLYLSDEGISSVKEVGYVMLEDSEIEKTRQVWKDREVGTREA